MAKRLPEPRRPGSIGRVPRTTAGLLNDAGKVIGVVSRSTERQARCASLEAIREALTAAAEQATPYADGMPPW